MNTRIAIAVLGAAASVVAAGQGSPARAPTAGTVFAFTVEGIDGRPLPLASFDGKVLVIVNVASKCGFTYQYEGLEALYERFKDRGLVILGLPSNDFLWQEPGTEAEIQNFCKLNYGVTFPMSAKIKVKGGGIHPLYEYLTSKEKNGAFGGPITWNFNKFLVGRDGRTLARFDSKVEPGSPDFVAAVEKALGEPR